MQRVRAQQTQQQQARHNEIERIRRRSAPVILNELHSTMIRQLIIVPTKG